MKVEPVEQSLGIISDFIKISVFDLFLDGWATSIDEDKEPIDSFRQGHGGIKMLKSFDDVDLEVVLRLKPVQAIGIKQSNKLVFVEVIDRLIEQIIEDFIQGRGTHFRAFLKRKL